MLRLHVAVDVGWLVRKKIIRGARGCKAESTKFDKNEIWPFLGNFRYKSESPQQSIVALQKNSSGLTVKAIVRYLPGAVQLPRNTLTQYASTTKPLVGRTRGPAIDARLLRRLAKFFDPRSSAPAGGPRGCLTGWLTRTRP